MASTGEKEQYGENQYGAWMNVMKGRGSKWRLCCCGKQNWFRAILPDTAGIQFWGASS
jgi:N-carbamoylputrescine amidase